jgi:hypothetical protein
MNKIKSASRLQPGKRDEKYFYKSRAVFLHKISKDQENLNIRWTNGFEHLSISTKTLVKKNFTTNKWRLIWIY